MTNNMAELDRQKLLKCKAFLEGNPGDEKLVHIFEKLLKFPVNIEVLQATGIGKSVNGFRKRDGEIGEKAKAVVARWKAIVAQQTNDSCQEYAESSQDSQKHGEENRKDRFVDGKVDNHKHHGGHSRRKEKKSSSSKNSKTSSKSKEKYTSIRDVSYHKHGDEKSFVGDKREKDKDNVLHKIEKTKHSKEKSSSDSKSKKGSSKSLKRKMSKQSSEKSEMSFEDFMNYDSMAVVKKKVKLKQHSSGGSRQDKGFVKDEVHLWRRAPNDDEGHDSIMSVTVPTPAKKILLTESDIMNSLPETQAHYRPWRFNEIDQDKKKLLDADELEPLIGTKSYSRTQVYSGRKNVFLSEVPTLFEACMKVLIDNIENLEYVGGVPFDVLKPVLERCTASQLYALEDFNPHFLVDSDVLWKIHCQREFKGHYPEEMETWREMYLRKLDEREAKLKAVRANITASMSKVTPARTTKLAYVDVQAKPPRDVRRKQLKYGTGTIKECPAIPGGYKASAKMPAFQPIPGPSGKATRTVKIVSPMMQKTMKMMKKLQRR